MQTGRYWRTARHLSAEQVLFTVLRHVRHKVWRRFPELAQKRLRKRAERLPVPDPHRGELAAIARSAAALQVAVHPEPAAELRAGRLTIFGQRFDFGHFGAIDWRAELGEGNSPLRRLTLAYLGWAVPLLQEGRAEDLTAIARAVAQLEAVPWTQPGIFRDLWNPYTASHRIINLLAGLHLYAAAGGVLTGPATLRLLSHIRLCVAFVASDLERDLQANHLFKNLTALAVYVGSTPQPSRVFAWLPAAVARSLDQTVLADGGHAERSPLYHELALLDVQMIAASGAVPLLEERLRRTEAGMRAALGILTHPDGDIALFNDAWLGAAPPSSKVGLRPSAGAQALTETGYVRLDADTDVVIFDCGPCGMDMNPGHAHADFLSLELSVRGERLIVDPGTATYTAGKERDLCRSAALHNGPHVPGHEPIEFWKSFRVGRRAGAGGIIFEKEPLAAPLWCAGWQNGYRKLGIETRRWVGLWPGQGLLVIDVWLGAAAGATRFTIPGSFAAGTVAGQPTFTKSSRVTIKAWIGALAPPEASMYWLAYGRPEPAHAIELRPAVVDGILAGAVSFTWGAPLALELSAMKALLASLAKAKHGAPAGHTAPGRPH